MRRKVSLGRAALVIAALALVGAACVPAAPPAPPPPSNGRLPDAALTFFSPACRVANEIAGDLHRMVVAANTAGIALRPELDSYLPPGTPPPPELTACYRSYDMQAWWRNYYCSIGRCALAAVPGTSKHGWGKAVDLEDGTGQMTFSSPGYHWLAANAGAYGFSQPVAQGPFGSNPEPWHWVHG